MRLCDQRASTINFDPKANAEKDREIEVVIVELTRTFNAAAKRLERLNRLVSIGCADTQEIKLLGYIVSGSARRKRDLLMDFFKQCLRARKQLLDGSGSGSILGATEGGGGGSSAELKEGITDALLLDFFKQCLGARKQLLDGIGSGSILGATEGGGGASSAELKEGITDAETNELATAETEVNERMQETQRIAKSVEDLAMLLKELDTLVVDQGSLGDRIDFMMDIPIRRVCGPIFYDKIEYNTEITLPGCGKIVLNKSRLSRCILTLVVLIVIMCVRARDSPLLTVHPRQYNTKHAPRSAHRSVLAASLTQDHHHHCAQYPSDLQLGLVPECCPQYSFWIFWGRLGLSAAQHAVSVLW